MEIFFLSSYIALSNWIWKIYHIDIILRPKLCQFVQSEISPSMSHSLHFFENHPCVDILRNKTERSILCKIRLSAHNLAVERGGHLGLHTSDIICTICRTGDVEDESHFLFKCEKYSNYRRSFQCNILSILQKNHLSENQMLKFCMNSNSLKVLRATCSYINNCLTLRNEIIQYS